MGPFLCMKIGVSHTYGRGVSQTCGRGVSHTCFGGVEGGGDGMRRCLANSQITMPAVVLTLRECLVPNWGISMQPWEASTTSWWTPFTSLPSTMAYLELEGEGRVWRVCRGVEPWHCSMEKMV